MLASPLIRVFGGAFSRSEFVSCVLKWAFKYDNASVVVLMRANSLILYRSH